MNDLTSFTRTQDFVHDNMLKIIATVLVAYPMLLATQYTSSVYDPALKLVSSMLLFVVGFVVVSYFFRKIDAANSRKFRTHSRYDDYMRVFKTAHALLFLFIVYRVLLCAYVNINPDTLFAEKYLLMKLTATGFNNMPIHYDFAHTKAVIDGLVVWFPTVSLGAYVVLNFVRRAFP